MEKLAIFDIDYTITSKESFTEFYKYIIKNDKKNIKYIPQIAWNGLLYLGKINTLTKSKQTFFSFLNGMTIKQVDTLSKKFYNDVFQKILYKEAIDEIKKKKKQGYLIYLISASAEFYLKELYNINEVDVIIGTKIFNENGAYQSKFIGENCKGEEKVRRLKEYLTKESINVDFKNSLMYSDSMSDEPLFELVGKAYLINYKKTNPKYEVLRWS